MLTSGALDFVVHLTKTRTPDGRLHRYISSIREVVGWDGAQVVSSEVFAAPPSRDTAIAVAPFSERRAAQLAANGYDQRPAAVRL